MPPLRAGSATMICTQRAPKSRTCAPKVTPRLARIVGPGGAPPIWANIAACAPPADHARSDPLDD
ncbi:MAG TPA: hypothetical protein VFU71_09165, partial [Burkholderiaceae bacterium]|nr:hypothetical protein [Burkholderiaceae bacterium]